MIAPYHRYSWFFLIVVSPIHLRVQLNDLFGFAHFFSLIYATVPKLGNDAFDQSDVDAENKPPVSDWV